MEDDQSGTVSTEIDDEITEKTDAAITRKHATLDWLAGYSEGERRGVADGLDALAETLKEVGMSEADVEVILRKILERSGWSSLFQ
jgi:hypothetical protein